MLPNRSTDSDNPRLFSDGKGLKEDRKGGRREKGGRTRRGEKVGEAQGYTNTKGKS